MKSDNPEQLDSLKSDANFMLGMYYLEKGIWNESVAT